MDGALVSQLNYLPMDRAQRLNHYKKRQKLGFKILLIIEDFFDFEEVVKFLKEDKEYELSPLQTLEKRYDLSKPFEIQ